MSLDEFLEHAADYTLDPWDETRADLRAGIIAATIANVHRPKDKQAYTPSDFMPKVREEKGEADDLKQYFQKLSRSTRAKTRH